MSHWWQDCRTVHTTGKLFSEHEKARESRTIKNNEKVMMASVWGSGDVMAEYTPRNSGKWFSEYEKIAQLERLRSSGDV